ncbi:hypothetical protein F4678DRAFT_445749 [Xylaria arbuscula]|nr:hypothetical protein F4678DRAFT_445749 [Xylaria arbuscula]
MPSIKGLLAFIAFRVDVLGAAFPKPTAAVRATACVSGTPTTTAGYPILYYTPATPATPSTSVSSTSIGYQPEPSWAREHLVGTYTFGVPEPIVTGFAYAQFKCEYYCEDQSEGGSFFVHADRSVGSYCECYDDLMDPESFVTTTNTLVGAWNAICKE